MSFEIHAGDRVTIVTPHGHQRTGRAVMLGPAGWVLNMGGAHGTPAIASDQNIVSVKHRNGPGGCPVMGPMPNPTGWPLSGYVMHKGQEEILYRPRIGKHRPRVYVPGDTEPPASAQDEQQYRHMERMSQAAQHGWSLKRKKKAKKKKKNPFMEALVGGVAGSLAVNAVNSNPRLNPVTRETRSNPVVTGELVEAPVGATYEIGVLLPDGYRYALSQDDASFVRRSRLGPGSPVRVDYYDADQFASILRKATLSLNGLCPGCWGPTDGGCECPPVGTGQVISNPQLQVPTRMGQLQEFAARAGYYVATWSPGDKITRYRFFKLPVAPDQSYFGPANGDHTALGLKKAWQFLQRRPNPSLALVGVLGNPAQTVGQEISHLIREKGYPQKRAVAAALSMERAGKLRRKNRGDHGLERVISLDEARDHWSRLGRLPEFEESVARHQAFWGVLPESAYVFMHDDGSPKDTNEIGPCLGRVPETIYTGAPPNSFKLENGQDVVYVHDHTEGLKDPKPSDMPMEVLLPRLGVTVKLGGRFHFGKDGKWWND